MARDLARHISRIPSSALPSGFLEEAGLHGSAADIVGRHSMASLMRMYSSLIRVHLRHAEANLQQLEQAAALERKRLEVRSLQLPVPAKTQLRQVSYVRTPLRYFRSKLN